MITAITRVRNESLIIEDTLKHYLGFCDSVILYDDASTDNTAEIASSFDSVQVMRGQAWLKDRPAEETRHRKMLLEQVKTEWTFCFDADERVLGELPDMKADGYRFRLFDGYMTPGCKQPYKKGPLQDLKRMWGPEFRDILMLFKTKRASYKGLDRREPVFKGRVENSGAYVKHFGKCLSVQHWEETCDYYSKNWPKTYTDKWRARKGKAIHTKSDFERPLYPWFNLMGSKKSWVRI